jgi:hypothetical protein
VILCVQPRIVLLPSIQFSAMRTSVAAQRSRQPGSGSTSLASVTQYSGMAQNSRLPSIKSAVMAPSSGAGR